MAKAPKHHATIDLNSTRRSEIIFVHLHGDRMMWFEFLLVDVVRNVPGILKLVFECRFQSSQTTRHRVAACDVDLIFLTPQRQTPFAITTRPIIEGPPDQEIEVTHTKSHRITGEAAISYLASLLAKLTRTSTHRYRITEKETRSGSARGLHAVNLRFHENNVVRQGLNGERRVSIQMDDVEGVTSLYCTFTARVRYTAVRSFGLTTSHLENIDTMFTLIL